MFFGEDKLKLDTFISARAAEEPVTANHKAFPLITPLKVRQTVTAADKQKEKSGATQTVDKAQSQIPVNMAAAAASAWPRWKCQG